MVDLEGSLDVELGALLNLEWLVLELIDGAGSGEIDNDVGSAIDLQRERLDNALAGVVGLMDGLACVQAERSLPALHGLIVLIYDRGD